jgi:hypothetical protein
LRSSRSVGSVDPIDPVDPVEPIGHLPLGPVSGPRATRTGPVLAC